MIEILVGFISGIISGMGIGGGMILIPALVMLLSVSQKDAQAMNLWYFLPTALFSICVHAKNRCIEYKKSALIILTGIPFALIGSYMALQIDPSLLGKLFGGFLAIFGIKEVYDGFTNKK